MMGVRRSRLTALDCELFEEIGARDLERHNVALRGPGLGF
jgi:hypothetical protein